MNKFELAYHTEQITKLKILGKESDIPKYLAKQSDEIQYALNAWMTHILDNPKQLVHHNDMPLSSQYKIKAWQAFYQQEYTEAHRLFGLSVQEPDWQKNALHSSLGLAKVYTRTGHWQLAKQWCLYYLTLARRAFNHFDIAKGYGALAEIFLRAGHAKEALSCFQIAYHLMPLQSGQKARQYNYMASALLRHKEFLSAEALLYSSYQEASRFLELDPNNNQVSILHSQMRIEFLTLLSGKNDLRIEFDLSKMTESPAIKELCIPQAMICIARGIKTMQQQDFANASIYFQKAMAILGTQFLLECLWANRLYQYCQQKCNIDYQIDPILLEQAKQLLSIQTFNPPEYIAVVDQTWQAVDLHNQGFAQLFHANLNQDELIDLWQRFFI